MKDIIITGASGFIGSNLIKTLYKSYKIIAITRETSNTKKIETFCEIYKYEGISRLINYLNNKDIIGVIHLATLYVKNHKMDDIKNIIDANITFGSEICEALSLLNFNGWFINVGTFWQFYKNMQDNPLNLYAASKSAFSNIINFYANTTNITFSTIYLNDTYGPNDNREKIFNLWLKIAKSGQNLEMSKGEQIIDLIYIDDVVDAFIKLIELLNSPYKTLAKNKIFALHTKERKTLRELSEIFEQIIGKKLNILWGAKPYMKRENFMPFEGGDILPNWIEKFTFKEGIREVINSSHS